jgi:acetyl esterase
MPVDPQILALLDVMAATGAKPVGEATVAEARAASAAWVTYAGPGEPVAKVVDRYIPGPTADLHIRVYTPAGHGPFPALVMFHGSGWVLDNIDHADTPHRELANRSGCVVVAVNYQKAPEHRFPVPLDDCYAAACWVIEHAALLDVDPARIGIGGDSAGGNLATACCIRAREAGGPAFALQLLIYPAVDLYAPAGTYPSMTECADGYLLTAAGMEWFWARYLARPEEAADPLVSPIRCPDLSGLPPAIVVTAEYDPLRDEGEAYADRLVAAGVPTIKRRYDGMTHAFYWMTGSVDASHRLIADLGRDVRAVLGLG